MDKKRIFKLLAAPLLLSVTLMPALTSTAHASSPVTVNGVLLTSYDWWNNSPPGCGIEYAKEYGYPTIDNCAGNSVNNAPGRIGTYSDPITFATSTSGPTGYPPGTIMYVPFFHKYFILEDLCNECSTQPEGQTDLWIGGVSSTQENDTNPADIVNLDQSNQTVIFNPPSNEPVNSTTPMYQANAETGLPADSGGPVTGHITSADNSAKCLDDTNNSTSPGSLTRIWDCSDLPTTWTVNDPSGTGTITGPGGLCMDVKGAGTANGSKVDVWTCNGQANQQWTYTGSELVGVQSGKCLEIPGGNLTNGTDLDISTCTGASYQKWNLP